MSKISGRKGKNKVWIIILIVIGVIGAGLIGGILISSPARREIQELTIADVNFNKLKDGTYVGEYVGTKDHLRDAKVEVTISGGKIADIKILKGALDKEGKAIEVRNGKSVEDLFDTVVESQSLQVDVISGATLTSKAHLKALENALKQAETD